MEIRKIDPNYSVAGQISASDIAEIAKAGFKSLICNRPDAEDGAVPHDGIAKAARAAGLEFRFIPVVSGKITETDVVEMKAALHKLPQPVLAYCRSGARCVNLYTLVQQHRS